MREEWSKEEMDLVKNTLESLEDILNNFPKGGKLTIHKDGTYTLTVPNSNTEDGNKNKSTK